MELEADNAGITEMLEKRNNLMLELEIRNEKAKKLLHICVWILPVLLFRFADTSKLFSSFQAKLHYQDRTIPRI